MMYPSEKRLTRFEGVFDNLSEWDETLTSFIEIIRAGRYTNKRGIDERFRKKILKYRSFLSSGDLINYRDGKKKLMGVTLAGVFREGRKDEHLVRYSGLVHVDLDKLQDDQVEEYRKILQEDPFVLVVFVSASGRGLKVVCWHPLGPEHHQDVYSFFKEHVQQLLKCADDAFDDVVRHLSRLCFVSHDPYAFHNPDASPIVSAVDGLAHHEMHLSDLSQKDEEPKAKSLFNLSEHIIFDEGMEQKYGAAVLDANCEKIRAAVNGQKHNTRLKQARTVAGYVAGGYIEESVAMERLISAALANTDNPKLAEKDIRAGFQHGLLEPLEVSNPNSQFSTNGHAGTVGIEGLQVREADPHLDQKLKKVKEVAEEFGEEPKQEKSKRKNPFILLREFLADVQPPSYLVQGFLEANSFMTLIGEPSSGKSFLAIDWACCIASGHDWHGRTVKQGAVIYFAGEGQDNMKQRFLTWRERFGKNPLDHTLLRLDCPALNNQEIVQQTYEDLEEAIQVTGPPKLIVIDTLARHYGGDNENDTQQMNRFVNCLQVLRQEYECSVLIVHHVGKDKTKGGRGSSALHGAVDCAYLTERTNDLSDLNAPTTQFRLKNIKMKDGVSPKDQFMDLHGAKVHLLDGHPLYFDDGVTPVTSCYLSPNEEAAEDFVDENMMGKKPKEIEIKAFKAFLELWEKGKKNLLESGRGLADLTVSPDEWSSKCKEPDYGLTRHNVSDIRTNKRSAFYYFHSRVIVDKKHMILKETNEV